MVGIVNSVSVVTFSSCFNIGVTILETSHRPDRTIRPTRLDPWE